MANLYPFGQCTWWASEYYHQLTGQYAGAWGNAADWVTGARNTPGWNVSSTPPAGVPSIMVLQPGTQGADPTYGHVAIVTKVNGNGTVSTSNMNVDIGPILQYVSGVPIRSATISEGPGVSFLWYGNAGAASSGTPGGTSTGTSTPGGTSGAPAPAIDLTSWGHKIGIFTVALVFVALGAYLVFQKQINSAVKSGVETAGKVAIAA